VLASLHAGFEKMRSNSAEPKVLHERPRVAVCAAADASKGGLSFPLGATVLADGVNFSVFSREASRVDLLLFDDPAATRPARVIELDPRTHRTYHY
jgi:glycogen operon protein